MNILIVIPKYSPLLFSRYEFPVGFAYISAVLKRAGHSVDLLNLNDYYGRPELNGWDGLRMLLERACARREYLMVCTGGISPFYDFAKATVALVKEIAPAAVTVIGGGLLTSEPELVFDAIRPHFGVIGEGEETIVELAAAIAAGGPWHQVRGIVYRDASHRRVMTAARPAIEDLDSLPFPDYEGFDMEGYLRQLPTDLYGSFTRDEPRGITVSASRSCPFKCSFCFHPIGNKYRSRSVDSLLSEIDHLVRKYRINTVAIADELFGFDKEYLKEFCRRIKPYRLDIVVQLHVSQVTPETIGLLKEAGCVFISFGIESASNAVLKGMHKNSTIEQIEQALRLTYEAGIQIQGNFIFGDASETPETAAETFAWWHDNRRYQINLSRVVGYPGSELWENAVKKGIITDKLAYIEKDCSRLWSLNLSQLTDFEMLKVMQRVEYTDQQFRLPAKVLSCRRTGVDYKKRALFSLEAQCPHCLSVVRYPSLHSRTLESCEPPFAVNRIGCRKCNQRFDLLPYKVEAAITRILEARPGSRLAILCADDRSAGLLNCSVSLKERVSCVLDDLARSGLDAVGDRRVIPLSNNLEQILGLADALIVTSEHARLTHLGKILTLQGLGLAVYELTELSLPDLQDEATAVSFIRENLQTALDCMEKGDCRRAFASALNVVDRFPLVAEGHKLLGNAALEIGDRAVAIDAYHTAQMLNPSDSSVTGKLAELYLARQEYPLARRHLERQLDLEPGNLEATSALLQLAVATADLRGLADALKKYAPSPAQAEQFRPVMNRTFGQLSQAAASGRFAAGEYQELFEVKRLLAGLVPRG